MPSLSTRVLAFATLSLTLSCFRDGGAEGDSGDSDGCSPGTRTCPCADGTCLGGLECRSGVCVDQDCAPGSAFCTCDLGGRCEDGFTCDSQRGVCLPTGGASGVSAGTDVTSSAGSVSGESSGRQSTDESGESTLGAEASSASADDTGSSTSSGDESSSSDESSSESSSSSSSSSSTTDPGTSSSSSGTTSTGSSTTSSTSDSTTTDDSSTSDDGSTSDDSSTSDDGTTTGTDDGTTTDDSTSSASSSGSSSTTVGTTSSTSSTSTSTSSTSTSSTSTSSTSSSSSSGGPDDCLSNDDCGALYYCDFPDGNCGFDGVGGTCERKPDSCPASAVAAPGPQPVLGCDCVTHDNACIAAAAGVDVYVCPQSGCAAC